MPTIVHFEVPADDIERAKKFYNSLFGWKIEHYQDESNPEASAMEYLMINTTDEKGEPGVMGGMMAKQHPQQPITIYIDVPSIDEYSAKVTELGGQVVMPKTPVPKMGYFAVCLDTENNAFALWENDENAG